MSKSRAACFGLALTLLASGPSARAQQGGLIRGTVMDENGVALQNAKVNAEPLDGRPRATLVRFVETDEKGLFLIDGLSWGRYAVFAMKEESGYPNMRASLYSNDVFPTVTIAPSSPEADLAIKLGPKAGVVTGSTTDLLNGAPVDARFKLTRAASPEKWLSMSAPPNFIILVPPSTEILLEVSSPGFKTWSPPHPLLLRPGAELHMDIVLEPAHDPNLRPSRFLVPQGYVGWVLLDYNVKDAPAVRSDGDVKIFRFPTSGALATSSPGPERGADDQYFYYSADGALQEISTDYRNGKGMIWGKHEGTREGVLSQFGFFVGTEEQYQKYKTRMIHPGPVPSQQPR